MDYTLEVKGKLCDDLIDLSLSIAQWDRLAVEMQINPSNIFGANFTNLDKAQALVDRVCQLGTHNELISCANKICKEYGAVPNSVSLHKSKIGKLDNRIAAKLGELYEELLSKLKEEETKETVSEDSDEEVEETDYTEFKEKLMKKAKFSPSNYNFAIESKNENTVLKRKAKKLGYSKYEEINKKIRNYYNMRILVNYPPDKFNADQRLSYLVNELYEFLPEYLQDDEAIEYLYGLIFDTTFRCFIFNE
ncbi:hypothetical protein [Priestia megaterium]|uniref:hypothetical protein n=1 Tax=Priestia megaterium TaxID=1404 RepID=UPI00244873C8|nr:hypothetical protein [Priestia megaterium]MDH2363469.1 hypothetical protein [Priestia megaterium]